MQIRILARFWIGYLKFSCYSHICFLDSRKYLSSFLVSGFLASSPRRFLVSKCNFRVDLHKVFVISQSFFTLKVISYSKSGLNRQNPGSYPCCSVTGVRRYTLQWRKILQIFQEIDVHCTIQSSFQTLNFFVIIIRGFVTKKKTFQRTNLMFAFILLIIFN